MDFDPNTFLAAKGKGKRITGYVTGETVFSQGDPADAVFFIQTGQVKLTVVSEHGKEAVVGMLEAGDFFGEECLSTHLLRICTAAAFLESEIVRVEKDLFKQVLEEQPEFSAVFVQYLLARKIRIQEDLVDRLFNSSEKRLARILLLLAHFGQEGTTQKVFPKISQETLAEMVGTTRSRISFFMNRFRKLGLIDYNGGLCVHSSLLSIVLHDGESSAPSTEPK